MKKVEKKLKKYWKNIARGTTDPGYWVRNLNDLFQPKLFQIDFSQKHDSSYRLNTLGPLCLWQCFIQNPLEVNYFKRRAIRNYYFSFNCTGNVWLMADFCPWDSRGGVMENKVWDRTKPKMGIYTMSDTDITWPENLLWIYLLQKK